MVFTGLRSHHLAIQFLEEMHSFFPEQYREHLQKENLIEEVKTLTLVVSSEVNRKGLELLKHGWLMKCLKRFYTF